MERVLRVAEARKAARWTTEARITRFEINQHILIVVSLNGNLAYLVDEEVR
jgi:hypothetical protein